MNKTLTILILYLLLSSFHTRAQGKIEANYKKGLYVDLQGNKYEGYIHIESTKKLKFLKTLKSKVNKVNYYNIDYITIDSNNYKVIHGIKLKPELGLTPNSVSHLIAKEILIGKINLYAANVKTPLQVALSNPARSITTDINKEYYSNTTSLQTYGEDYFIVKKQGETFQQIFTGNKKFRTQIDYLVDDNLEFYNSLNFDSIKYFDIINIVKDYNTYFKNNIKKKNTNPKIETLTYQQGTLELNPETPPSLIGGEKVLNEIMSNIELPLYAKQSKIYGTCLVEITLDTEGTIINKTIKEPLGYGCNKEALRIASLTEGKWIPAEHKGQKVNTKFMLPIKFMGKPDGLNPTAKQHFYKGLSIYKRGNFNNALGFFESASTKSKNYIDALYFRANCYYKLDRKEDACTYWSKAIDYGLIDDQKLSQIKSCKNIKLPLLSKNLIAIDSVKYTDDFVFRDGAYRSFEEFKFNLPSIRLKKGNEKELMKLDIITYSDISKLERKLKKEKVWGYCLNGEVKVFVSNNLGQEIKANNMNSSSDLLDPVSHVSFGTHSGFTKIKTFGIIIETEAIININNLPNLSEPSRGDQTVLFDEKQVQITSKYIDFLTGKDYSSNSKEFEKLIQKDIKLYNEYMSITNLKERKYKSFMFLKRFNERNPMYFYLNTYK